MTRLRGAALALWATVALVAAVGVGALTAFVLVQEFWAPERMTGSVSVFALPPGLDPAGAFEAAATETGGNLYVSFAASDGGVGGSSYGVFVGDPGTVIGDPDAGTFPGFPGAARSSSVYGDTLDPPRFVGVTFVQGASADDVAAVLADAGIETSPGAVEPFALRALVFLVAGPGWAGAFLVLVGALGLAAANLAGARLSVAAARRSLGWGWGRVLAAEGAAVLVPALLAAAAPVLALGTVSLLAADGWRLETILVGGAVLGAAPILAAAGGACLVGLTMRRRSPGQILVGARPVRLLAALSVVVIAAAAATAGAAVWQAGQLRSVAAANQAADAFREARPDLFVALRGWALAGERGDELADEFGELFAAMEGDGLALRSTPGWLSEALVPADPLAPPSDDDHADGAVPGEGSLLMDPAFLGMLDGVPGPARAAVEDRAGQAGAATLLVPTSRAGDRAALVEAARATLDRAATAEPDDAESSGPALDLRVLDGVDLGLVPRLEVVEGARPEDPTYDLDPVVLVADQRSGLLRAADSGNAAVFSDRARFDALVAERGLGELVVGVNSIADLSAAARVDRVAAERIALAGAAALVVAVGMSAALLAAIRQNRLASALFLRSITGAGFWRRHGGFLAAVGALAGVAAGLAGVVAGAPVVVVVGIAAGGAALCAGTAAGTVGVLDRALTRAALEIS